MSLSVYLILNALFACFLSSHWFLPLAGLSPLVILSTPRVIPLKAPFWPGRYDNTIHTPIIVAIG